VSRKIVTRRANPKRPRENEEGLTKAVADFLDVALAKGSTFTHVASGGYRPGGERGRMHGQGVRRGCPDFVIVARRAVDDFGFRSHVVVFIELKTASGALEAAQETWRDALKAAGAWWFLCRSVEEVEAALRDAGASLKAEIGKTKKPPAR